MYDKNAKLKHLLCPAVPCKHNGWHRNFIVALTKRDLQHKNEKL